MEDVAAESAVVTKDVDEVKKEAVTGVAKAVVFWEKLFVDAAVVDNVVSVGG